MHINLDKKLITLLTLWFTWLLNISIAQTSLSISPQPAYFGKIPLTSSSIKNIQITNTTGNAVNITGLVITGLGASNYYINSDQPPFTINPYGKLVLEVVFAPETTGEMIALMELTTSLGNVNDTLIGYGTYAISGTNTFERIFGTDESDRGSSVKQTQDGGFIIIGSTTIDDNDSDMYAVKTDIFGKPEWTNQYGGNFIEGGADVWVLDDGYLLVGKTDSYGAGSEDVYIVKIDANGNQLWQNTFGGIYDDAASRVIQLDDGSFIIAGNTKNNDNPNNAGNNRNALLIKCDAQGNLIWSKNYGGDGGESATDVLQTPDGGFIFVGSVTDLSAEQDVYLVKTDASGNLIWNRELGGSQVDGGSSIYQTDDGGYIIGGSTLSYGLQTIDAFLLKVTSDGTETWHKTFGHNHTDGFSKVLPTPDGGYLCVGSEVKLVTANDIYDDIYLVKTDASGNLLWEKNYGGSKEDSAAEMIPAADGGYVIVGTSGSYSSGSISSRNDIYFLEVDIEGEFTNTHNDPLELPKEIFLSQNYPNPFNPATTIDFKINSNGGNNIQHVSLKVYDILGKHVATLFEQELAAGEYQVRFNAENIYGGKLASGIYFYRLLVSENVLCRKMILLK